MFPRIHPPGTDPIVFSAGHVRRSEAAAAKAAKSADPVRHAVTSVRACIRDLDSARAHAEAEYAETHAPVSSPIPMHVHADVAAILKAFLRKAGLDGADLLAPINPHESLAAIEQRHRAQLQSTLDAAKAELLRAEREEATKRLVAAQAALAAVDASHARQAAYVEPEQEPEPVDLRPPVPSLVAIEDALAEQDTIISAASDDAPRRRGRPPRVSLDPSAGDESLPMNEAPPQV